MGIPEIVQNIPVSGGGRVETFRFHDDAVFPDKFSLNTSGGPGWRTFVHDKRDGVNPRVGGWPACGRRRYAVEIQNRSAAEVAELVNFAINREGSLYGFLLKDARDFSSHLDGVTTTTNPSDRIMLCCGDGSTKTFRLVKQYVDASGEVVARPISRPISGTLSIWNNGAATTETTDWVMDYDTGYGEFVTAPAAGAYIEVTFQFRVPVRFELAVDEWLQATQFARDDNALSTLGMVELPNQDYEAFPFRNGGFVARSATTNAMMIDLADGIYQEIDMTGSAFGTVYMPNVLNIGARGPILYLKNTSGSATITLSTIGGIPAGLIGPGVMAEIYWTGSRFMVVV